MRIRLAQLVLVLTSFVSFAPLAHAAISACGNVYVSAHASCEFVQTTACSTKCVPTATFTACAAQLYVGCDGQCVETTTASCTETCTPTCVTECMTTQATTTPPNSRGLCMSQCQQDCNGSCAGQDAVGPCRSSCAHNCDAKCDKHCTDTDTMTACTDKCSTVCTGDCSAQSTSTCQIDCQATGFSACETTVSQKCTEKCTNSGGAIFCDGQFLDASDLSACAAELAAKLDIHVDVSVKATVNGKSGCSTTPGVPSAMPIAVMVLFAGMVGAMRLRRRQLGAKN